MKTATKMCLSKQSYSTKKEAMVALKETRRDGELTWFPLTTLNVYKCPFCFDFHIGNRSRR